MCPELRRRRVEIVEGEVVIEPLNPAGEAEAERARDAFLDEMRDYAREIVDRAKNFEYEDVYGSDPPLGPCPACGRPVYESAWYYRCLHPEAGDRENDCPMRFWKDVYGRYLDRETVREIIQHDKTGVIDGFTARDGRTYRGWIELDREAHEPADILVNGKVVASGEVPPGLQFIAPYAATTIAEHFMAQGRDVLVVYDDLTRHARAYRELSLLLRRPPGREAYPGDIFYIHARLLERATHLDMAHGGGSLTALPIVETEAQNISAYIPTNLISITDGQIVLSPQLVHKGVLPAVDVGRSVSRVGGKAQLPAYRALTGSLRLSYAQFEELEAFARFGTRLDDETRQTLRHGQRVREVLKQPQYAPMPVAEQVAVLFATAEGVFDDVPLHRVEAAEEAVRDAVRTHHVRWMAAVRSGEALDDAARSALLDTARRAVAPITEGIDAYA